MDNKVKKRILIFNFILICFIVLDLFLPNKSVESSELSSFYNFSNSTGSGRSRTVDDKCMVELSNGGVYRVGRFPSKSYGKGVKIEIMKSALSSNVNQIKIYEKVWVKYNVGLFSIPSILIFFVFSILITISNKYIDHVYLKIALVFSMMFLGIVTPVYFFAF